MNMTFPGTLVPLPSGRYGRVLPGKRAKRDTDGRATDEAFSSQEVDLSIFIYKGFTKMCYQLVQMGGCFVSHS